MKSILCKKGKVNFLDRVHVINTTEKEKKYEYLEPKGEIYCLKDLNYNVLLLNIGSEC